MIIGITSKNDFSDNVGVSGPRQHDIIIRRDFDETPKARTFAYSDLREWRVLKWPLNLVSRSSVPVEFKDSIIRALGTKSHSDFTYIV